MFMKVFVATTRGQGDRAGDVFHGVEGELVRMPLGTCANPRCGCDRSVTGLATSKTSTTFMAVERPEIHADAYRQILLGALDREGWLERGLGVEDAARFIDWHIAAANHYPADTVLRAHPDGDETRVESPSGCACHGPHRS